MSSSQSTWVKPILCALQFKKTPAVVLCLCPVPCIPTNISVKLDCSNKSADVSWSPSRGALRYSVLANSSHSDDSCTASDLSCLACGANYTVQVVAKDDRCSSLPSLPVHFESGKKRSASSEITPKNLGEFVSIVILCSQGPARLTT